ncbi:2-succinyl-5-enolpyruvyl-6-hydroxy-3-cyclohexene-1-carboxylic-acid synthase [Sutcliffiella rhizosphaerae]|uniref:2-succinyl-5-enolpyruvyl-6-hydroxy-3-cyclohexene-1-carboxylate synthase n=1 Tax=Sutcliffiella rhizosphaerae TaxID=2880967 RepID=A0ABM8YQX2_9BACI|nr:2-succinyl-5-enolpyruvyl-6-hydroxy-3-cyclohexene-1-carboxylic-acid synthase [Sutcliffiella rhizosphaerae]CAG9622399.1 2-succinyl-5-enolpyruvyl-6-hydroxy-3-cyclohexene-1-carboxylate synthase [Sutcliffiella rhizosphaerae]
MNATNDLTYYLAAFVDELVKSGMREAVISPGSRSTPIALLMAEHPELHVSILVDERSAAFYALGLAKTTNKPVAILCTSGTAATNYYPAIVEAYQSRIPLIVLTADRPHELRDVGAPQAIDQLKMYGDYVKWFVEMSLPEDTGSMIRYARTMSARALGTALSAPRGPVHMNFPIREPLIPNLEANDLWTKYKELVDNRLEVNSGEYTISEERADYFARLLNVRQRGIIVCGEVSSSQREAFITSITELSDVLGYPIFADPLSGLRTGRHSKTTIMDGYDAFLRPDLVKEKLMPEVIIRFGAMPVSKFLTQYISKSSSAIHIVVDGDGGWRDPTLQANYMIHADETYFCNKLLSKLQPRSTSTWLDGINKINERTKSILQEQEETLFEGKIIRELQELLPDSSALFVGNSMPIRDVDTFLFKNEKKVTVLANRGANGIDGVVSTALAASNTYEPLVLVIGDLSFYHDMNGLLAAKLLKLNATIVLVNNNGGGIFSFLPQSKVEQHFEQLFGTPTGLDFKHTAALYDADYCVVSNWSEFQKNTTKAIQQPGLNIIEVPTNRVENEEIHRRLWNKVSQEMILSLNGES